MYKRYDLSVFYSDYPVYSASFSSINLLLKIACGFDSNVCRLDAVDTVLEKSIPVDEYMQIFKDDVNGI